MTTQQKIMYGATAIQIQLLIPDEKERTVWFCKKCRRVWGPDGQHMASWCCCNCMICACGNEHEKHWTMCDSCREKKISEKWFAKTEVIWDGNWPVSLGDGTKFFFDADQLIDYIQEDFDADTDHNHNHITEIIESLRVTSCIQNRPREFDIIDWLSNDLPEDHEIPDAELINDQINAILTQVGVVSFSAGSDRLNVRDLLERIGFKA